MRFATSLALCLAVGACNNDGGPGGPGGGPLAITAVVPVANDDVAEPLVTVAAVFNQGINPATLTTTTFRVKHNGTPILTGLTWDGPAQTARAPAALLPGQAYEIEVSTGVETPGGSSLATPEVWSFTTRPLQEVSVGSDAAVGPSLAREANGRLHVAYTDGGGANLPDLKYATCAAACEVAGNWTLVAVDTASWQGETPAVAVDGAGRVHIAYGGIGDANGTLDFKYATCSSACTVAANWQTVTVDTVVSTGSLTWFSLAADAGGRVHVSYYADAQLDVKYGTCAAACATAANWQTVALDTAVTGPGSLALDGSGRVHVAYSRSAGGFSILAYATCAAACGTAAGWQQGDLVAVPLTGQVATAVEAGGQVHVVFDVDNTQPTDAGFGYAHCVASCTVGTNWVWGTVSPGIDGAGASVAVDTTGRVLVIHHNAVTNQLRYASCVVNCALGTSAWRSVIVASGAVAGTESLELGSDGRLHIVYTPSIGSGDVGFWYSR